MIDNYFTVYKNRRRALVSGKAPDGLGGDRPPQARTWLAYQHRMSQEPPWERAQRYQLMISQQGLRSIRALARATGENHSRLAKIFKVLALPERVLEVLRAHADNPRVRAHFSERRLRQLVKEHQDETSILQEIEQVLQSRPAHQPDHVPYCR